MERYAAGYPSVMTSEQPEQTGRLDDAAEEAAPSSTTDGPAAEGEYDPQQGSPDSGPHPTELPDTEQSQQ